MVVATWICCIDCCDSRPQWALQCSERRVGAPEVSAASNNALIGRRSAKPHRTATDKSRITLGRAIRLYVVFFVISGRKNELMVGRTEHVARLRLKNSTCLSLS